MGLFSGPTTDAERRAWQRRAHRVLGDLLDGLHPIGSIGEPLTWTVGANLTLVGRANSRAAWQAWVDYLDATPWPERTDSGYTHLHAVVDRHRDNVTVAVLADIDEED